ncbi:MAG TPA: cupin domain-containing protein [Stellaceae bacterium]|jgi:quercetin dioxygenase-like cupin family protein|nr:cupin domain-containing protein [Stellaceae bacterium]
MESRAPTIIDLDAELAKLTMFRGLTPQTARAERQGTSALLGPYREGILFGAKYAGTSHWETHPADELVHVLDGTKTLDIICDDGPPRSFVLHAGMLAVVPQGAWHRFRCVDGGTTLSATFPGDHIEVDVDDPRMVEPGIAIVQGTPGIIDLNAERAKLRLFQGRTPQSTMADRKGSAARLASFSDGGLSITKFAGKGHWEAHLAGDELIHVLDGAATLEIVGDDGPRPFALRAGMLAVNPRGAWHRFQSSEGVTLMAITPSPSKVIELDVDDPRSLD